MNLKKKFPIFVLTIILILPIYAHALTMLPDPNTLIPGVDPPYNTLATKYEDFWVYSGPLNTAMGFPGFDYATGTGTLDVIIYTGAGTVDRNQNVGPGGAFDFEDPIPAPAGGESTFSGTWGKGNQPNGPVLVDIMLNYLQSFPTPTTIPMYIFDMAEPGDENKRDLQIVGHAYIYDPATDSIKKEWIFDNNNDGIYNENDWITAFGKFWFYPPPYDVDHHLGSGKLDFIAYASDMDLSQWANNGYYFVCEFKMKDLDGGYEELYISGDFTPIPEPGTMILLTSGLLGIGVFFRKRIKN